MDEFDNLELNLSADARHSIFGVSGGWILHSVTWVVSCVCVSAVDGAQLKGKPTGNLLPMAPASSFVLNGRKGGQAQRGPLLYNRNHPFHVGSKLGFGASFALGLRMLGNGRPTQPHGRRPRLRRCSPSAWTNSPGARGRLATARAQVLSVQMNMLFLGVLMCEFRAVS